MPINRVVSTLPDQEYIRALEAKLLEMERALERANSDIEELQRRIAYQ